MCRFKLLLFYKVFFCWKSNTCLPSCASLLYFVYLLFPSEDLLDNFLYNLLNFDLTISFYTFNFSSPFSCYYLKICYFFHLKVPFFLFLEKKFLFLFISFFLFFPIFSEISHVTPVILFSPENSKNYIMDKSEQRMCIFENSLIFSL